MKEEIKQRVLKHAENLIRFFDLKGYDTEQQKLNLCRKLLRLENKARAIMENRCNGTNETEQQQEEQDNLILNELNDILNFRVNEIPAFLNGDPRGYTLKVDNKYTRQHYNDKPLYWDWGEYGIIAPDLRND